MEGKRPAGEGRGARLCAGVRPGPQWQQSQIACRCGQRVSSAELGTAASDGGASVCVSVRACVREHVCACVWVCVFTHVCVCVCACVSVYVGEWIQGTASQPAEWQSSVKQTVSKDTLGCLAAWAPWKQGPSNTSLLLVQKGRAHCGSGGPGGVHALPALQPLPVPGTGGRQGGGLRWR